MSTYKVYLAPTLVPLKDLDPSVHLPISFKDVARPANYDDQTLSQSYSQRYSDQARIGEERYRQSDTSVSQVTNTIDSNTPVENSTKKSKRAPVEQGSGSIRRESMRKRVRPSRYDDEIVEYHTQSTEVRDRDQTGSPLSAGDQSKTVAQPGIDGSSGESSSLRRRSTRISRQSGESTQMTT